MVQVEPIVLVKITEEISPPEKGRCSNDAMAKEPVFSRRVGKFYYVDIALPDGRLYFGRRVGLVDDNEMLDIFVALIGDAFDRAKDTSIAGCRRDNCDERIRAHSKNLQVL